MTIWHDFYDITRYRHLFLSFYASKNSAISSFSSLVITTSHIFGSVSRSLMFGIVGRKSCVDELPGVSAFGISTCLSSLGLSTYFNGAFSSLIPILLTVNALCLIPCTALICAQLLLIVSCCLGSDCLEEKFS